MMREKITLGWRGTCAAVADIIFDDDPDQALPVAPALPAPRVLAIPPIPSRTAHQQHMDNVLRLLDSWAEWIRTGEPLAEGAPRQCLGAPDARIHSFEDMEIEVNKRLVREVHTAVWDLAIIEREAIMMHYGLNTRTVWRADFRQAFDQAVERLFLVLKAKIAC